MYTLAQLEFQFLGLVSSEINHLLEVQEVQVGLVVLVGQALPTDIRKNKIKYP